MPFLLSAFVDHFQTIRHLITFDTHFVYVHEVDERFADVELTLVLYLLRQDVLRDVVFINMIIILFLSFEEIDKGSRGLYDRSAYLVLC